MTTTVMNNTFMGKQVQKGAYRLVSPLEKGISVVLFNGKQSIMTSVVEDYMETNGVALIATRNSIYMASV